VSRFSPRTSAFPHLIIPQILHTCISIIYCQSYTITETGGVVKYDDHLFLLLPSYFQVHISCAEFQARISCAEFQVHISCAEVQVHISCAEFQVHTSCAGFQVHISCAEFQNNRRVIYLSSITFPCREKFVALFSQNYIQSNSVTTS
jgi:hypothetical protein